MRVAIGGSTGLIGSALTQHLRRSGHEVVRLVRRKPHSPDERHWDLDTSLISGPGLDDVDAVVNLAGAGLAEARWTQHRKQELLESRLRTTRAITHSLASSKRCGVFLSGSAIGIYGDRGDELLDERSSTGSGFLAEVCLEWEQAALTAQEHARVVLLRTGHVLAGHGGILGRQKLFYQLGLGGRIGSGQQWVSWISLDDHVAAMVHLLTAEVTGPVNLVGPDPVINADLTTAIGRTMRRPTVLPLPLPVVRALFGSEMVREAMLASQRVLPRTLRASGFTFTHPPVDDALQAALG